MKKKIVLALSIIILMLSMTIVVKAADDEAEVVTTSEQLSESQKSFVDDDVFDAQAEIEEKNKAVYGNEFLCGNMVNVENVTIQGDLYVVGNNIKIKENVFVDGNIFVCGSNIEVQANVDKDVFAMGQCVSIGEHANIGYSLFSGAEVLKVEGIVSRNINATANDLEITETASVYGDLNYTSTKEGKIAEGTVSGKVNFDKQVKKEKNALETFLDYLISLIRDIIFVTLIFILILFVAPKFVEKSKEYIGTKLFKSIGIGLVSLIILPIIAVLLIVLNITLTFGLLLIPVYCVLLAVSGAVFVISLASKLCEKFEKIKLPIMVPIITAIVWALEQIPYVNSIVILFIFISGFGIIIQNLFKKKSKE